MSNLPPHLGGHLNKTHIDEGSLDYFINRYKIKTFVDVGCGPGGMVALAKSKGLYAYGIDGDWTTNPKIIHDYITGPLEIKQADLIWCVEFLEHVEETYVSNYMKTLQAGKYVFCTASTTSGHHHVNCKDRNYWVRIFEHFGFEYQDKESELIRTDITTMNLNRGVSKQFVKNTGMFFKNKNWENEQNSS